MKKPAKPDRWERMVGLMARDGWSGDAWAVSDSEAVAMLRAQHAATVRMVKRLMAHNEDTWMFKEEALGKVLAWLERRRR